MLEVGMCLIFILTFLIFHITEKWNFPSTQYEKMQIFVVGKFIFSEPFHSGLFFPPTQILSFACDGTLDDYHVNWNF